ncbi:Lrp/AsnC ligand binding domain-containing protein [Candidatus Margulisiibacteriota bacterium]
MSSSQAYILIETLPGKSSELIEVLKVVKEFKTLHFVSGPYDVIAFVEAADLKSIGEVLIKKIRGTGFVSRTVTCIVMDQ